MTHLFSSRPAVIDPPSPPGPIGRAVANASAEGCVSGSGSRLAESLDSDRSLGGADPCVERTSHQPWPSPQGRGHSRRGCRVGRLAAPLLAATLGLPLLAPWLPQAARAQLLDSATGTPLGASPLGGSPTGSTPALPPLRPVAPAGALQLPPQAAPLATPQLGAEIVCPTLQQRLLTTLGGEVSVWSVSVADPQGRLLADINGQRPRVPASNQKLLSTAFALDRLGPDFRLNTQLWRLSDGSLRLTGQGDPDLALPQLQRFARLVASSSGGQPVRLELAELPSQAWWPQGWAYGDRSAAYGAPVTRLAITSNVIEEAVMNPPARLRNLLGRALQQQGARAQVSLVDASAPLPADAVLLHEEPSITMHGLLSLANTESHNFTAEVLLRSAAGTWSHSEAARLQTDWLRRQGLPMQGVVVADGSGLDRSNRLTSRFLAALLLRMDQHPYGRDYLSSMAITGQRGTLRRLYQGTSLDGRLFGKTGTLTGVRAISGVLQTSDGPRYVSAISNGASAPNQTIGALLRQVQEVSLCAGGL